MSNVEKELHLSILDQQPHIRVYGRHFVVFPFPDLSHADVAVNALRIGLCAALRRFPYFAGTIEVPNPMNGRLRLVYPNTLISAQESSRLLTASFGVTDSPQFRYEILAREGLPASRLPSGVFCPALIKHHPGLDEDDMFAEKTMTLQKGIPVPALAAQATFIPSGLVLSLWVHHCVADGVGVARLYEVWSENVRGLMKEDSEESTFRRTLSGSDMLNDGQKLAGEEDGAGDDPSIARRALDALVYCSLTNLYAKTPQPHLRQYSYKVVTKMFHFNSSIISELRSTLSSSTNSRISRFVALAALLWAQIIRARWDLLTSRGYPRTTLAVVADLRNRLGTPFTSPDYLGNLVLSAKPTWTLPVLSSLGFPRRVEAQHLAPLAHNISRSLQSIDRAWVTSRLAYLASSDPPLIDTHQLTFPNGPDLYITSWEHMGADCEWHIPGTSSAKPVAIRRAAWVSEGGMTVLPRQRAGAAPHIVMLSLAEEDMARFEEGMRDGGWLRDESNKAFGPSL